jgi:hypothetical protein
MSNLIKDLTIQVGGKTIKLKVDDARKLYEALEELFGSKVIRYYDRPYYPWYWNPTWYDSTDGRKECVSYTSTNVDCRYDSEGESLSLKVT